MNDLSGPCLDRDHKVDVAIVGAGFTGLTAALHLLEAGRKVAIVEADVPGAGASGRCAGFVVPNLARADPAMLIAKYGKQRGEQLARLIGEGGNKVFTLAERYGAGQSVERSGWIQPVVGKQALAAAQKRFQQWQSLGQPVEWLQAAAAEQLTGVKNLSGAWRDHSGGTIQPQDYIHSLAKAVVQQRGLLFTQSPVKSLVKSGADWRLETAQANLYADKALVCTNGIGCIGLPALDRSVLAVNVIQVATQPLTELQHAADQCNWLSSFRYTS